MTNGLIHALVITPGAVQQLSPGQLASWQPEDGLLWVHLDATDPATENWLNETARLPEVVVAALVAEETRPRAGAMQDALLLNLRGINQNPRADPEDMVSIRIWADANRIISARIRPLKSLQSVVDTLGSDSPGGSGDLIVRLAGCLVERVTDEIDSLEDRAADLEQAVLSKPDKTMRAELADLRRDAIAIRRYLAPQREALNRLQGEKLSWFTEMDRLNTREVNDRLIRQLEDLDAIRERAAVVQEELLSQLSELLNQRTYVLSIVAAIFLPLGFLTGLLGINVGGIPGADSPLGFGVFTGLLVIIVAVQLWYFIRKGWF